MCCQACVDEGFMTQEQLDQRVLDGDLNVMPIGDLTRGQAAEMIAGMVSESIAAGHLDILTGFMVADELMAAYDIYQSQRS